MESPHAKNKNGENGRDVSAGGSGICRGIVSKRILCVGQDGIIAVRGVVLQFSDRPCKYDGEKDSGTCDGEKIGDRFGGEDRDGLILHNRRHDINEGQQEEELPYDGHGDRGLGITDGHEGHLTRQLDAEDGRAGHIDPEGVCGVIDQVLLGCEHSGKSLRKKLHEREEQDGIGEADEKKLAEGQADALQIACAVIVADDRLGSLSKALQREHGEHHDTGQNGHGTDSNIAAVALQ